MLNFIVDSNGRPLALCYEYEVEEFLLSLPPAQRDQVVVMSEQEFEEAQKD